MNQNPTQQDSSEPLPLWQFVPLADYRLPGLPARSAAGNVWSGFKQIFRRQSEVESPPFKQEKHLRSLAEVRLAHLVGPVPWLDLAAALDQALEGWLQPDYAGTEARFLVAQPFAGQARILAGLAERRQAVLIPSPSAQQILAADFRWFDHWPEPQGLWLLPHLERCYLRHAQGLGLLRELFRRLERGQLGKGLIACDSWAWAYMQHILPLPRGNALTLQAFDAERLQRLFIQLVQAGRDQRVCFYNASNGRDIIRVPAEGQQPRDELVQLSAYCRGNMATALHYWRERLRTEPDQDETEQAQTTTKPADLFEESVWVTEMLPEPTLPIGNSEEQVVLLHALLLHAGLEAELLYQVLPLSANRCAAVLSQLHQAGLLRQAQGRWQVHESAYAAVRRLLRGQDYLIDEF